MQIEAVTRAVLRRRAVVLLIWLAILLAGAFTSLHLSAHLTNRISLPGTDSERAEQLLESHFGQSSVGSFTLVVKTEGSAHALLPTAQEAARRAAAELPTGAFVDSLVIDENVIIAQIASSLDPVAAKGHTAAMRAAVGKIPGAEIYLTGLAAAEHDADAVIASDLRRGELFIALPIAIVLLILIFRTFAFLLPIVFALFTIVTTLGLVRIFANLMELTAYITSFVSLIGLGIAVDYSLLIAHRFREELLGGAPRHEAIVRTMNTAGRAVVFSGSAVTIGLALLVFLPMPFLRGFGVGGLLMGVVSVAAALTLQPVLLSFFGESLDRVKLIPSTGSEQRVASARSFWPELARWIMRRPVRVAAASSLLLLACGMPLREIRTGPGSDAGQPDFLESAQGRAVVAEALGAGATTPTSIVIDTGSAGGANSARHRNGRRSIGVRAHGRPASGRTLLHARPAAFRRYVAAVSPALGARRRRFRRSRDPRLRRSAAHADHPGGRFSRPSLRANRRSGARGKGFPEHRGPLAPMARARSIQCHVLAAGARIPLPARSAKSDRVERLVDRRCHRAHGGDVPVGLGGTVRLAPLRPDRGLDFGHGVCCRVRPVDGLRSVSSEPNGRNGTTAPRTSKR